MIQPTVSVLVPYRPESEWRERLWVWCWRRWQRLLANSYRMEVILGDDGGRPFSRAASVNAAAEKATGDVRIIADSDLTIDYNQATVAITQAAHRQGWVLPYVRYMPLNRRATEQLVDGAPVWPATRDGDLDQPMARSTGSLGGVLVLHRSAFDRVGGMDPTFRGWGFEDVAFVCALRTLVAPDSRVAGDLVHLWHPTNRRPDDPTFTRNRDRCRAYERAQGDPAAIRALRAMPAAA
ncbi:MAG TPA: galactosyltransferase-related protein [Acidimicrobiales bacterium]|jgi:hypothetical protein